MIDDEEPPGDYTAADFEKAQEEAERTRLYRLMGAWTKVLGNRADPDVDLVWKALDKLIGPNGSMMVLPLAEDPGGRGHAYNEGSRAVYLFMQEQVSMTPEKIEEMLSHGRRNPDPDPD
jgi:hypothetical protein